ncbi:palmitoyltransferase ZDHHC21-like [Babylonia areolata]|uniref:palmitoyltransferase ZDHHC21-like n=1 Tax=Babylonia areolata TaxID=304850 RepID=UPI003FD5E5CF
MDSEFLHRVKALVKRDSSAEPTDSSMAITLPMIGRVHFVKDRSGFLQVCFVFAYWVYGSFSTLYIILLPQYNDGRIPYSIVVSFMLVSVMCLLSLVKASFTNPGTIPSPGEEACFDTSNWTYCKICNRKRPSRAHHCRRCKQCVMRMDHHCPWINNCVGEQNHFAFTLLLFYAFLLSTFTLSLTIFHFWVWPKCSSCDREVFYIKHSIWFMYLLVVLASNMALLMFLQFSFLHSNILYDRTTLENLQLGNQASGHGMKLRQMYTAYRDLCGRGWVLCWLWPCRQRAPLLQPYAQSPV